MTNERLHGGGTSHVLSLRPVEARAGGEVGIFRSRAPFGPGLLGLLGASLGLRELGNRVYTRLRVGAASSRINVSYISCFRRETCRVYTTDKYDFDSDQPPDGDANSRQASVS